MFWLYAGFFAFLIAVLLIDLKVFHTKERLPTPKQSGAWVAIWVGLALLFGVIVLFWLGPQRAGEYYAGYLVEYALSVDNMFVFLLIFSYFRIPLEYQHQVLFFGILGAMVFRGLFIAAGAALITNFNWVIYIFGAFLIYTAIRIARDTEEVEPEHNPVLKFARRFLRTTHRFDGQRFFTIENGRRVATPLFVVLLVVETTDVVFAVDSIPAIFGITLDPFIVVTSNMFAVLGLRALYFLIAGSITRFHLLKYGLSFILGFVGVKMLLEYFEIKVPILLSLGLIIAALAITVVMSLRYPPAVPAPVIDPADEGTADES